MPAAALHQRLDDQRRQPPMMLRPARPFERRQVVVQHRSAVTPAANDTCPAAAIRTTSNNSGSNSAWNRSTPPTLTLPSVSPWYASARASVAGFFRPWLRALLPVLKGHLQGRFDGRRPVVREEHVLASPAGASSVSRLARRIVVGFDEPNSVTWATRSSCSRKAASSRGCRCPWTLHHRLLTASSIARPWMSTSGAALAAFEDQRLVLGHLSERVPDDLAIPASSSSREGCVTAGHTVRRRVTAEAGSRCDRRLPCGSC